MADAGISETTRQTPAGGVPSPEDRRSLADIAAKLARTVGDRIREMRDLGVDVAATKSSATDVVTEADREAERTLTEAIIAERPDDGIVGEEGAVRESRSGITWVIDPIDGTVNYLYGIPAYAVSVAATVADPGAFADERRAVAGAVCNPRTDELFVAWEGGGATRNGVPLRVSEERDLGLALVGTGFGYTIERRTEQAELVARLIPRVRDIRRIGAASYDLCLVAAGSLDLFYERGLQPWDYAAGALIAKEAGAAVLGGAENALPGEPMLITGNPALAEELRRAING